MGQGLTGSTLEVIERSWKFDRFGGHRKANENLRDPVLFFTDSHKRLKRESRTNDVLVR